MSARMYTFLIFLGMVIGVMTMPHDVQIAFAEPKPLGTPRWELATTNPEEGVRVYQSVGLPHLCYLTVTEWDGIAAGKSSSIECP